MKRNVLSVVLVLFGGSVHAMEANPLEYYQKVAGRWAAGRGQESVKLQYSLHAGQLRVEGESCAHNPKGPATCLPIDQDFSVSDSQVMRDDLKYGPRSVEIVEMNENKIVRAERNPIMKNRLAVTTEELKDGGRTLEYTVQVFENGKVKYSHAFTLDRVPGPSTLVSQ